MTDFALYVDPGTGNVPGEVHGPFGSVSEAEDYRDRMLGRLGATAPEDADDWRCAVVEMERRF